MNKLKCSVEKCGYNRENKCCLDGIKVKGTDAKKSKMTSCGSFREKTEGENENNEYAFEPVEKSYIECEVLDCVHNFEKNCDAKRVSIKGESAGSYKDTYCNTFKMD